MEKELSEDNLRFWKVRLKFLSTDDDDTADDNYTNGDARAMTMFPEDLSSGKLQRDEQFQILMEFIRIMC